MIKKTIVIYYSKNGSNKYLAKKIAKSLDCEIEQIMPKLDFALFLLFGPSIGNKKLKSNLLEYDRAILCGPIWMGKFISPLKSFVKKYNKSIKELIFTTCCGSSFEMKEKKFGHGLVFKKIKKILLERCSHCEAFPIALLLPDDKKEDPDMVMKTRLTDDNFTGEIRKRFEEFIVKVSAIK